MKRIGEQGGGNFLLMKIIVEGARENFLYKMCIRDRTYGDGKKNRVRDYCRF